MFFSSSTGNGTEFTVSGVVILITMTKSNIDDDWSSGFELEFTCYQNESVLSPGRFVYPTTFVTGDGPTVASFPEKNAQNYSNNANHLMVISRASGQDFNLTLKFTDIEPVKDYFVWFFLQTFNGNCWFRRYGV